MLTYWMFKGLFGDYDAEISVDDFGFTLLSILFLAVTLCIDVLLLIPELIYLGFKLLMRRFGK